MKYYGDLNGGLSEKEKLLALNRQRNLNGWFDKVWAQEDLRGSQRNALFEGDSFYEASETSVVWCQLNQLGDLIKVIIHDNDTKIVKVDRLSGEKKVIFHVKQPFEYEE